MSTDEKNRRRDELRELLAEALSDAAGTANVGDEELAVVAEQGIEALESGARDRVLSAIAGNVDGAAAAIDVRDMLDAQPPLKMQQPAVEVLARSGSSRILYRSAIASWALAACVTMVFSVALLIHEPSTRRDSAELTEVDGPNEPSIFESAPMPTPIEDEPVLESEQASVNSSEGWHRTYVIGLLSAGALLAVMTPMVLVLRSRWRRTATRTEKLNPQ